MLAELVPHPTLTSPIRMKHLILSVVVSVALTLLTTAAHADDFHLGAAGPVPQALVADVKALLAADGSRVTGEDGTQCELWLVKSPARKKGFKPDLRVKYPFEPGALVGVLRVGEQGEFVDFRDQVILPGLYTLRYGQQPQDGNHVGTSQQADFLLALPAEEDESVEKLTDADELNAISADAAGSSHPAIFSLLAPEAETPDEPTLTHEADHDFWILQTTADAKRPGLRLVVVGIGEE